MRRPVDSATCNFDTRLSPPHSPYFPPFGLASPWWARFSRSPHLTAGTAPVEQCTQINEQVFAATACDARASKGCKVKLSELFKGRVGLPTSEMARVLNRQPQTLRRWATYEDGPIKPVRVNGRLMWLVADAERVIYGRHS